MSTARIGILTISDRASRGVYEDKGGPAIHAWLSRVLLSPWEAVARVIPDEQPQIEDALRELSDIEACSLIVTTGGTGPALRDVTPEATEAVCTKMMAEVDGAVLDGEARHLREDRGAEALKSGAEVRLSTAAHAAGSVA